jgi:lipoic acid synthetase
VQILTIGQYLQPSRRHHPVRRYVEPAEFDRLAVLGRDLGLEWVEAGPLVRSSYHAREQAESVPDAGGPASGDRAG